LELPSEEAYGHPAGIITNEKFCQNYRWFIKNIKSRMAKLSVVVIFAFTLGG
jgi:hypothetical protein